MDSKMLDSIAAKMSQWAKTEITWAMNEKPLLDAVDMVKKVFGDMVFQSFTSAGDVHLQLKCKSFEEVAPVVKLLTHVFKLHQPESKSQTGLSLTYIFRQRKEDTPIQDQYPSTLKMVVDISSGPCKLVQIGTKTVEQPIYEMRCGDDDEKEEVS